MHNLFVLDNRKAIVTGSTRGIGAACARALAQAGADLCLIQRPADNPNLDTYNRIREESPNVAVHIIYCDLADMDAVKNIVPQAIEKLGGQLDILVNCGGIQRRAPAVEFPESDWDDVLNVNLKACFLLAQAAAAHMIPRKRGKIINFCSLLTFQGGITVPAYAAAKGGLGQLTKALSNEWSKEGIQVNGICPGYIATDMHVPLLLSSSYSCSLQPIDRNEKLLNDPVRLRQISERIPAGRWGTPEDFAGPVVFLASDASNYVCGELLVVDGGWMGR